MKFQLQKWFIFFALMLSIAGCHRERELAFPMVEIGVFYGGQVQRVRKVEVSRDQSPKIGVRIEWPRDLLRDAPPSEDALVQLEVTRPGPSGRRVIERSEITLGKDQDRVDRMLPLASYENVGTWNIRLTHAKRILADRALYLVSPP